MDRLNQLKNALLNMGSLAPQWIELWNRLRVAVFRALPTSKPKPTPTPEPTAADRELKRAKVEALVWAHWKLDLYDCFGFCIIRKLQFKVALSYEDVFRLVKVETHPNPKQFQSFIEELLRIGVTESYIQQDYEGNFVLTQKMQEFLAVNQITVLNIALVKDYFHRKWYGTYLDEVRFERLRYLAELDMSCEESFDDHFDDEDDFDELFGPYDDSDDYDLFAHDSESDARSEVDDENQDYYDADDYQKYFDEHPEDNSVVNGNAIGSNESQQQHIDVQHNNLILKQEENLTSVPCDSVESDAVVAPIQPYRNFVERSDTIGDYHKHTLPLEVDGHNNETQRCNGKNERNLSANSGAPHASLDNRQEQPSQKSLTIVAEKKQEDLVINALEQLALNMNSTKDEASSSTSRLEVEQPLLINNESEVVHQSSSGSVAATISTELIQFIKNIEENEHDDEFVLILPDRRIKIAMERTDLSDC